MYYYGLCLPYGWKILVPTPLFRAIVKKYLSGKVQRYPGDWLLTDVYIRYGPVS